MFCYHFSLFVVNWFQYLTMFEFFPFHCQSSWLVIDLFPFRFQCQYSRALQRIQLRGPASQWGDPQLQHTAGNFVRVLSWFWIVILVQIYEQTMSLCLMGFPFVLTYRNSIIYLETSFYWTIFVDPDPALLCDYFLVQVTQHSWWHRSKPKRLL